MATHLSTQNPGITNPLVFTQVDTNVGNGYDSSTGIFTAPVTGTYSFNVQLCTIQDKGAVVGLFVNNIVKTKLTTSGDGYDGSRTLYYPALLKQGDKVQAKMEPGSSSGSIFTQDTYRTQSFSGALLR